jgi:hypothetical protein
MKTYLQTFIITFLLFANTFVFSQNTLKKEMKQYAEQISATDIESFVSEMVDPKYKGRLGGTPEYMEIAKWSAQYFKEWGLTPIGDDNSFFQYFNRPYCDVIDVGEVVLNFNGKKIQLTAKTDYYPGANSASGIAESELVFVGYGITNNEAGYDDYAKIDVKNKIVLILNGVPYKGKDAQLRADWTFFNSHAYKYSNALQHGAIGALLIDMMAAPSTPLLENFRYASISNDVANDILAYQQSSIKEIENKISDCMCPHSFPLDMTVVIRSNTQCYEEGITANVVGFIEGNDPNLKDEIIIVGAHLDGQGSLGFLLPSALDNASGVANVMAVAKHASALKGNIKRSILFILFGAEECGLIGSLHYADNPIFPLENTMLMINLDMVGNGTGIAVWGGKSYPEEFQLFEKVNEQYIGRKFTGSDNRTVFGRPRTDGMVFLMRGIPTVHLGITDATQPVYYHSHKDVKELLSYDTMEDVARFLYLSLFYIANK